MLLRDRLRRLQLIVVTGKGGVGKSVMTAAVAHILAGLGRRTLALEIDPRETLHHLYDAPPSGGEILPVGERLYLQNLKPAAVVDWVLERQVKIGLVVERVRRSAVYHRFVEGAPGLTEMAILGHALRLVRGDFHDAPKIDTVVLDAPATGHGVYLLTAARLFGETIGSGPFAELALEVADFVEDVARTGLVVVTLAEEMPVQEALELRQRLLDSLGRQPEMLVTNALYPPLEKGVEYAEDDALAELWRRRREVNDKELARLAREWEGPRLELPLLPIDQGPRLVAELHERLEAGLEALTVGERGELA